MYLADAKHGEFHVVLEGRRPVLACGPFFLCLKTVPQPPDLPICQKCWEVVNPGVRKAKLKPKGHIFATLARLFNLRAPKARKPLEGQRELFEEKEQ